MSRAGERYAGTAAPHLHHVAWHTWRRAALRGACSRPLQRAGLPRDHLHRGAVAQLRGRQLCRRQQGRGTLPHLGGRHAAADRVGNLQGDHELTHRAAAGADAGGIRVQLLRLGPRLSAPTRGVARERAARRHDHQRLHAQIHRAHVRRGLLHPRRRLLPAAHLYPLRRRGVARRAARRRRLAGSAREARGVVLHLARLAQAHP
mmetsp:Transcript_5937/g.12955  ORF Transcript_5937/g.12955 Transcript_5937/m.12955 type:complete len:204 (+) Transcript_5937:696-1307(+)